MQKSFLVGIIVVVIVAAFLILTLRPSPTTNAVNEQLISGNGNTSASGVKFTSSPYYQYAYLISGNTLSVDAQTALTGFALMKKENSNGTTTYTLTAKKQGYVNQTYTLSQGESLYFIERTLVDDNTGADSDFNLGDDMAIVVNSGGYIVQ